MQQKIATTDLVNFEHTLWRFQVFGEDAANYFDGELFRKAIHVGEDLHILSLFKDSSEILMELEPSPKTKLDLKQLVGIAKDILGLNFPLKAFYEFAKPDPILLNLTSKFTGLRPTLTPNLFEALVTSITAQQINLRFAFTVRSRIVKKYGESIEMDGRKYYAFPTPHRLAGITPDTLKKLQLTAMKSEYIVGIAEAITNGEVDLAAFPGLANDEIADILLPIRGIGRWTVDWLLARGLGRGDAAPVGDLGVRKAIQHFYFSGEKISEEELRKFTSRWGDFANLAIHYLLKGLMMGI